MIATLINGSSPKENNTDEIAAAGTKTIYAQNSILQFFMYFINQTPCIASSFRICANSTTAIATVTIIASASDTGPA